MASRFHRTINNAATILAAPHVVGDNMLHVVDASSFVGVSENTPVRIVAHKGPQFVIFSIVAVNGTQLVIGDIIEDTEDMDLPSGQYVADYLTAGHLNDVYDAVNVLESGGIGRAAFRIVETKAERNALPNNSRTEGMIVYTAADQRYWQLLTGPWLSNDSDWLLFSALNPFEVPTFVGFTIKDQGNIVVSGTAISDNVTFLWSTANSNNIQTNSIRIVDTTSGIDLATGLANNGTHTAALPSSISHTANQLHTWSIIGIDTKGNEFSSSFTVHWVNAGNKTYYVRTDGNDSNSGLSDDAAGSFLTIQQAANLVDVGDTVRVRPGTYAGFTVGWDGPQNGASGHPISFLADSGVTINHRNTHTFDAINVENCSNILIDGFTITNDGTVTRAGIRMSSGGFGNTIRNNSITGTGRFGIITGFLTNFIISGNACTGIVGSGGQGTGHGIYSANAGNYGLISLNSCLNNAGDGIHTNGDISQGGTGVQTHLIIEKNTIVNNNITFGGAAINSDGIVNSRIQNNLIYNQHSAGIAVYSQDASSGSSDNVICNNTVILAADSPKWCLRIANASIGNKVFNNIFWNASSQGVIAIDSDCLTGFVSDYNTGVNRFSVDGGSTILTLTQWRTATSQDTNSFISGAIDSLFVNTAANNYTLKNGGSAVNAGITSLSGESAPEDDIAGNPRPYSSFDDLGCYESQTVTLVVTNVTPEDGSHVTSPANVTFTFDRNVSLNSIVFALDSVQGSLAYDDNTFTATFTPASPIASGQTFTPIISAATSVVDNLNLVSPYSWSFSTIGANRLFATNSVPGTVDSNDGANITLGVLFKSDIDGQITKVMFYKSAANTGTHVAKIWNLAGTLLATKIYSNESDSGWQSVTLDTPISISANVRYWVSVWMPNGHYSFTPGNTFASGYDNSPLHVNQGGTSLSSGYGTGDTWPDANHSNTNYWIDVEVIA